MMKKEKYTVLGIMSGSSLDGLDMALCEFYLIDNLWHYKIIQTETQLYSEEWVENLSGAHLLDAGNFISLDRSYGYYIGQAAKDFLNGRKIDFISSHGHTIFHQPEKGYTFQLGHGANIAAISGQLVINDFRSLDVALGGQGAPLVPVGDELLFGQFDYCLNLGGFANISYRSDNHRIAYDICPVNFILNYLHPPFDKDGEAGRKGNVDPVLLEKLNHLPFYHKSFPKSLGREWVNESFLPVIQEFKIRNADLLRTIYEHISYQISTQIKPDENLKILVSGGGTYNNFLMQLIREKVKAQVIIPEKNIIEFKEAIIFAFLGVLRYRSEINCLSSVTGAIKNNCGGAIWSAGCF